LTGSATFVCITFLEQCVLMYKSVLFFCRSVSRAGQGFMATQPNSIKNKEDATGWTIEDNGKCDWFERKRKGNIHNKGCC